MSFHLWGSWLAMAPYLFHGPWLKLLPPFRLWFSVPSEVGGDGQASEAPRHYDLTKHPPLGWAPALLYPEPKNGSQCMSLPWAHASCYESPLRVAPSGRETEKECDDFMAVVFMYLFFVLSGLGRDLVRAFEKQRAVRELPFPPRQPLLPKAIVDQGASQLK